MLATGVPLGFVVYNLLILIGKLGFIVVGAGGYGYDVNHRHWHAVVCMWLKLLKQWRYDQRQDLSFGHSH
jgi:hypothetical protein